MGIGSKSANNITFAKWLTDKSIVDCCFRYRNRPCLPTEDPPGTFLETIRKAVIPPDKEFFKDAKMNMFQTRFIVRTVLEKETNVKRVGHITLRYGWNSMWLKNEIDEFTGLSKFDSLFHRSDLPRRVMGIRVVAFPVEGDHPRSNKARRRYYLYQQQQLQNQLNGTTQSSTGLSILSPRGPTGPGVSCVIIPATREQWEIVRRKYGSSCLHFIPPAIDQECWGLNDIFLSRYFEYGSFGDVLEKHNHSEVYQYNFKVGKQLLSSATNNNSCSSSVPPVDPSNLPFRIGTYCKNTEQMPTLHVALNNGKHQGKDMAIFTQAVLTESQKTVVLPLASDTGQGQGGGFGGGTHGGAASVVEYDLTNSIQMELVPVELLGICAAPGGVLPEKKTGHKV